MRKKIDILNKILDSKIESYKNLIADNNSAPVSLSKDLVSYYDNANLSLWKKTKEAVTPENADAIYDEFFGKISEYHLERKSKKDILIDDFHWFLSAVKKVTGIEIE